MDIHVCKQCGSRFVYCRKCVFRPVRYKDAGFCSKECYEASKNQVAPTVEIEPIKEEILTEDIKPIKEEISVEVEIEEMTPVVTPTIEVATVVEPTIKKETNTYKKKKNKYKVHE